MTTSKEDGPLTLEDLERLAADVQRCCVDTGCTCPAARLLVALRSVMAERAVDQAAVAMARHHERDADQLRGELRSVMAERDALQACLAGDHDPADPDYAEDYRPVFRQTVACKRCGKEVPCG